MSKPVGNNVISLNNPSFESSPRRVYKKRPNNWREIAMWVVNNSDDNRSACMEAIKAFNDCITGTSEQCKRVTIARWTRDIRKELNDAGFKYGSWTRTAVYGSEIENLLKIEVDKRIALNIPTSNIDLQNLLVQLLIKHNCKDILEGLNNKTLVFGDSWAQRFWKRNKIDASQRAIAKPRIQSNVETDSTDVKASDFCQ